MRLDRKRWFVFDELNRLLLFDGRFLQSVKIELHNRSVEFCRAESFFQLISEKGELLPPKAGGDE